VPAQDGPAVDTTGLAGGAGVPFLALVAALLLGGCSGVLGGSDDGPPDQEPVLAPSGFPVPVASEARLDAEGSQNPLTGGSEPPGPVLAVALDGSPTAEPWAGLGQADVVYLDAARGGGTGLLAVFQTEVPEEVGPVREAAAGDIDLLGGYGPVAYAAADAESSALVADGLDATGVLPQSPDGSAAGFGTDPVRTAPLDVVVDGAELLAAAPGTATAQDVGFRFGSTPDGGTPTSGASYPSASGERGLTWSAQDGAWRHEGSQGLLVDTDGEPLRTTSVLFLAGADAETTGRAVGEGEATLLRDAQAFEGTWSRESATDPLALTDETGEDLLLGTGSIWVVLLDGGEVPTLVTG